MANNQQNVNQQQSNQLQQESIEQVQTLLESLKEVLGIRTKLTEFERDTLNVNKKLAELVKNQKTELVSVAEKAKEIAKNESLLAKARLTSDGLANSLNNRQKAAVINAKQQVELQVSLSRQLDEELKKAERGQRIDQQRVDSLRTQLADQEQIIEAQVEALNPLQKQLLYTQLTTKELEEQNKQRKKELELLTTIENRLGIAGKLTKALGQIPGLGDAAAKAYENVKNKLIEMSEKGEKLPGKFKTMTMVVGELGKSFVKGLFDPLTLSIAAVTMLVKGILDSDKATTGLQKTLGISKTEAIALNMEFSAASLHLKDMYINSRDMIKSFGALQNILGSVGKVSAQSAETFARLNKLVGLTEEEAAGLTAQYAAFSKNSDQAYVGQLRTTHEVSKQYKTQINQKAVLAEVGKASAYTLVQFRGSTQALTEAVAKSKALGLSMETLSKISSGLLDFQTSIENELSAELLTGKQLNLEQARYYALTNQQSKLMDELNSQIGTFSDFSNLNVVQQEAYAKALGMSSKELSEMLFKQEYRGKTEQEIANIADEDLRKRAEALSIQDKLQAAVDKLSATFADFVGGPVGKFLLNVKTISAILGYVAGSQLGKLAAAFGPVIAQAATYLGLTTSTATAATATATAVSFGAMLPVILGAIGAVIGALVATKADDLYSPGQGNGGYGKRMLVAPEGTFALNNKDNIIATTNPVNVNDMISGPAGKFNVSTPAAATKAAPTQVNIAPTDTRINLNIDGAALGNAIARQNYKVGNTVKALGGAVDYSASL